MKVSKKHILFWNDFQLFRDKYDESEGVSKLCIKFTLRDAIKEGFRVRRQRPFLKWNISGHGFDLKGVPWKTVWDIIAARKWGRLSKQTGGACLSAEAFGLWGSPEGMRSFQEAQK